jgi:signal transduction histidine kinase
VNCRAVQSLAFSRPRFSESPRATSERLRFFDKDRDDSRLQRALRQIIDNLIANAIKFTPQGKVRISFHYFPEREQLECKVEDNGIGISAETLPFIFDKFRQADSSNTRSYDGVGLGLYIAKEFARLLGGDIDVQSEPERGTTFTVMLPC